MIWESDVQSRPWPKLVEFYRDLVQEHGWPHAPMLRLVERIAESEFASGLFATHSHADLWVAQTAVFGSHREMLCVSYDGARFRFEYFEGPFVRQRWMKECGPGGGWDSFQHFLRLKGWFVTYSPALYACAEPRLRDEGPRGIPSEDLSARTPVSEASASHTSREPL